MKKKKPTTALEPAAVLAELNSRVLSDSETCRRVWQESGNPVAVVEAVRQSTLPEWLVDALLMLLTAEPISQSPIARSLWKDHERDATAAVRAGSVAVQRAHPARPQTLDDAIEVAKDSSRRQFNIVAGGADTLKADYYKVANDLVCFRSRYYQAPPGLPERIVAAVSRLMDTGPLRNVKGNSDDPK